MVDPDEYDIKPSEFDRWLTPPDAIAMLSALGTVGAITGIGRRVQDGYLRTGARRATFTKVRQEYFELTAANWVGWDFELDTAFWSTGETEIYRSDATGYGRIRTARLYGVRFEPASLGSEFPQFAASVASSSNSSPLLAASSRPPAALLDLDALPNKGGRPRAKFWDDLIIEVVSQIYEGTFKPTSQADVVRAMQDWVSEKGYTGGLTQIKPVAEKIFKTFK